MMHVDKAAFLVCHRHHQRSGSLNNRTQVDIVLYFYLRK